MGVYICKTPVCSLDGIHFSCLGKSRPFVKKDTVRRKSLSPSEGKNWAEPGLQGPLGFSHDRCCVFKSICRRGMSAFVLGTRYLLRGRKDPRETPVFFAKRRVFRVCLDSQYMDDAFVVCAPEKHYFLYSCGFWSPGPAVPRLLRGK